MNAMAPNRHDGMLSVLNRVTMERQRYGADGGVSSLYSPDEVYQTDGIAAKIIDKPAQAALAAGFKIEGDENNDILNEFDRLDTWPAIADAIRWSRLHGGAAILLFLDDGLPLTAPLDLDRIRSIEDITTYSASVIQPGPLRYVDPTKKNYGWPATYDLRPVAGETFEVHESRLIFLSGDSLPPTGHQTRSLPWIGRSAIDMCYTDLVRYRAGLRLSQAILERKQQLIHKMSDLGNMLNQGMDDIVAKRLGMADAVRGVFNMLAVDAADDVILADTALGGIDSVLRDYKIALCASSGIPMPILFGEQTSGLNANAEGELSIYHDEIRAIQNYKVRPLIEQLAGVIWAQRAMPRREPQSWQVVFNPLFSPSDGDRATTKRTEAEAKRVGVEAMVAAMDSGLISQEEGRQGIGLILPELDLSDDLPAMPDDTDGAAGMSSGGNGGSSGTPPSEAVGARNITGPGETTSVAE